MYSFPELIKEIREEAGLKQSEFAEAIGVSTILISMIETGQKEVSKNFIVKLAERMDVRPASITPFLFTGEKDEKIENLLGVEKLFVEWGEKMQLLLIKDRAPLLKKYARR